MAGAFVDSGAAGNLFPQLPYLAASRELFGCSDASSARDLKLLPSFSEVKGMLAASVSSAQCVLACTACDCGIPFTMSVADRRRMPFSTQIASFCAR